MKKQRYHFADRSASSQSYGLSSSHVWTWNLDHKEGRALKKWCFWTVVQEKTLESPLDSKEIKSFNLKGNQPWTLIGRTDAEVETSIFCSSEENSWLIRKVLEAGKDWGQKEMRVLVDEMVDDITYAMDMNLRWWGTERPGVLQSMGSQRVGHDRVTEQQQQRLVDGKLWNF